MRSKLRLRLLGARSVLRVGLLVLWPAWVWSQSITATISVGAAPEAVAVNKITHKIYVANYGSDNVTVIDATTDSTTTVQVGARPLALAINEATNKIYVANRGEEPIANIPGSVTVIDGGTNSTTTLVDPNAHWPWSLAVNPSTNKIYVANAISGNVTVIDGFSNSITTVTDPNASGLGAHAVAVNPVTNKIYVVNNNTDKAGSNPGNVTVIDGTTNSTTTITDPNAFGPNAVAVNTVTNRIYVANGGAYPAANHGNVTVIDGTTNSTTTVTDRNALAPQAVAVNQTTNKIYVTNGNDSALTGIGGVTVIDGTTNAISTVRDPNAMFPHALSVDSVTDMIYVANEGCFPPADPCRDPGSVTVINGATNSTTTIINPQAHNPEAVAVDPMDNQIYVANTGSANVTVIDGGGTATKHTLAVVLSGSGSGTVTSNPLGINCGTTCIESVPAGTAVSLNALASSGSEFSGWSGPCTGTGSCDLVVNSDQFVTATFGTPAIAVPNVVGMTQAAATTAITGAGLTVGAVSMQSSSTVPSGSVISESPAAGTSVTSGSAVNFVVSTGPVQVVVPNVVGQTQAAAATAITGAGLTVGAVSMQSSSTVPSGSVISESPAAGTNVASGSAVNFVVSTGGGSGSGGGGGIDALTLGALLSSLFVALRKRALRCVGPVRQSDPWRFPTQRHTVFSSSCRATRRALAPQNMT
jgi:YVTN family beta-propeller protein